MPDTTTEIQYQHTLGCEPWALARVSDHPVMVGAVYFGLGIVGALTFNPLVLLPIGLAAYNDLTALTGAAQPTEPKTVWTLDHSTPTASLPEAEAIDVPSESVPTPKPIITPPPATEPQPEYPDNPFTPLASTDQADQVETSDRAPSTTPTPEQLADWEAAKQDAERVDTEQANSHLMAAGGIAQELVTLEDGFLRSWLITGLTGSGKGVFLTYALLLATQQLPGISLWGIDPKADPEEYSRWATIPQGQHYHFDAKDPGLDVSAVKKIEAGVQDILDRFYADKSTFKILIVDELPAIAGTVSKRYCKQLISTLSRWASMGRSAGCIVWISSNAVGLAENGFSKSGRDYFHEMYLITERSSNKVCGHVSSSCPPKDADALAYTGRAAWASTRGSEWVAVPRTYQVAVDQLPVVRPPNNLGGGEFAGAADAIAIQELEEELIEVIEDSGLRKLNLSDAIAKTSVGVVPDEKLGQIVASLKQSHLLQFRKVGKGYRVMIQAQSEDNSSSSQAQQSNVLDNFW